MSRRTEQLGCTEKQDSSGPGARTSGRPAATDSPPAAGKRGQRPRLAPVPGPPGVHARPPRPEPPLCSGPRRRGHSPNVRAANVLSTSGRDAGTASEDRAVRRTQPVWSRKPRGPPRPCRFRPQTQGHRAPRGVSASEAQPGLTFESWARGALWHIVTDVVFALTAGLERRSTRTADSSLHQRAGAGPGPDHVRRIPTHRRERDFRDTRFPHLMALGTRSRSDPGPLRGLPR